FAESQSAGARMSEELLVSRASQTLAESVTTVDSNCRPPMDGEAIDSEDDDSWLALDPEELDALMRKTESVLHEASQ
ncbi:hypothetical protein H4R20_006229, partial [Coemansia guatemalensis]